MESIFKFSIIIAVYNVEDYLKETIESIIHQTLDFKRNVQLILVDDGSSDNSLEIALDYQKQFPDNILVLSKDNGGQASARNLGLEHAKGKYINFLDSDDYLSNNTLKEVYDFFEQHYDEIDIVAIPMQLFERIDGPHRLNYKFKENRVINLMDDPNNPLLSSSSSFIKFESIKNYQFDVNLVNLEDALVISKILLDKKQYGVINTCNYFYRQRSLRNSTVDNANSKKEYFTDRLKNFYLVIIDYCLSKEGNIPYFIQYLMAYDLQWLLKIPNLDVFDNDDEINEFWDVLNKVLNHISIDVIHDNDNISDEAKGFFLYLMGEKISINANECDEISLNAGDYEFDKINKHRIWLDIVKVKKNILYISGMFLSTFNNDNISFRVIKENGSVSSEEYLCKQVEYNTFERGVIPFLGKDWLFCYNFDVEIPLNPHVECDLKFFVDYAHFEKIYSYELLLGLNYNVNLSKYAAYILDNPYIILFKFNRLYIKNYHFASVLKYEYSNLKRIILDKPKHYLEAIFIRSLYFVLYFFMRNKRIWIFCDRPDFSDDNAKHLFKYALTKNDNIKKYFILNKDSKSFKELESGGNILPFASLRHKILFLFAEMNICSYVNEGFINPFYNENMELYRGITNSNRIFLQHGVTKDDISNFIKKYTHDLSLIVTVSELEKKSFLSPGYNYDESVVQVLGFPRYDNLSNDCSKKQLLFMPTWRLQLETDEDFINSEYYTYLKNFLGNPDLFNLLKQHGYKLIFKPHAELLKYMDLLDISDEVFVAYDDSYQDLFNESSLLITDYSSVFFDFAFLKKPVIYYQSNQDYHYDEGYFDYKTMGFGDVVEDFESLLLKIEYYLNNGGVMEENYRYNVDMFFKFNDSQNCKRVYDWILNS